MKLRALLLVCAGSAALVLAAHSAHATEAPLRLSQSLAPAERAAAGLDRLSSDQIAVLDALYRRDLVTQAAPRRAAAPAAAARFSQRLSADERRNAGLVVLNEAELDQIDALASRRSNETLARTSPAQPAYIPVSVRARIAEAQARNAAPEIHGSFTLGFGVGSGGYSEKFGGMTLTYEDPARGLAVGFSYAETHVKGGHCSPFLRDPYDSLSPFDSFPRYSPGL